MTTVAVHEGCFVVGAELGLHARPSAQLTQVAGKFASEVYIAKNGRRSEERPIS